MKTAPVVPREQGKAWLLDFRRRKPPSDEANKVKKVQPVCAQVQAGSADQEGERQRCKGDDELKKAESSAKQFQGSPGRCCGPTDLAPLLDVCRHYRTALAKYSEGLEVAPQSFNLLNSRAQCYAALEDWAKCREDALALTRIKPDNSKGWILLVRALLNDDSLVIARRKLTAALEHCPEDVELLTLKAELHLEVEPKSLRPGFGSDSDSDSDLSTPHFPESRKANCSTPAPDVPHITPSKPAVDDEMLDRWMMNNCFPKDYAYGALGRVAASAADRRKSTPTVASPACMPGSKTRSPQVTKPKMQIQVMSAAVVDGAAPAGNANAKSAKAAACAQHREASNVRRDFFPFRDKY